jgi:hypothetical protein
MSEANRRYVGVIRVFLALAFAAAGLAKLAGVQLLVAEFARIGLGQWLRYGTGVIEVGAAVLLWVPGYAAHAAAVMVAVALGAVVAHVAVLGMATVAPAVLLGVLALIVVRVYRAQLKR